MSSTWTNFSVRPHDDGPHIISEDIPACASCRRRKLRCSREHPSCSHCERLTIPCVYEAKQKPGLKLGAVEALTRRVAFLEQILLNDNGTVRQQFDVGKDLDVRSHDQDIPRDGTEPAYIPSTPGPLTSPTYVPTPQNEPDHGDIEPELPLPRKRKLSHPALAFLDLTLADLADHLPSQPLILKLVDYFCVSFHHWIPYLHKARLRKAVCDNTRNPQLDLVLHALVAATLRHLDRNETFLDDDQVRYQTRISRHIVETFSIREVSLGSLQALIIIVFEYLNDGQPDKAWPLIGSLTRTVDYLQLTLEPSASQFRALMNPLKLVHPTNDWTELEERRRLFWVIFLLDRFCSVSTGWNTSLTSEDVRRRLPADGGYFTREEAVSTPYFGIWNKASARIGKSLAHVPAQYNEDDPTTEQVQGCSPASANGLIDSSKLGAFAYCIEATESLSQVTTFFLQQPINWQDKEHAVNWLTRFKELDLRLVHWKLFLPPRWKDSNISPDIEVVLMDTNLTLAHITHNTSMILLHHPIAYPAKGWNDYIALPKECSAQTCEHAAIETANIVGKFLKHCVVFVNVQFAFCTFVAAKTLLFQHQATATHVRPEFQMLHQSLREMSARWRGTGAGDASSRQELEEVDQAWKYATHLDFLLESCQKDRNFRFDLYDHSCLKDHQHPLSSPTQSWSPQYRRPSTSNGSRANDSSTLARPMHSVQTPTASSMNAILYGASSSGNMQSPSSYQQTQQASPSMGPPYVGPRQPTEMLSGNQAVYSNHFQNIQNPPTAAQNMPTPSMNHSINGKGDTGQDDSLLSLSDAFMDSQFLGLDRVITFEDANFYIPSDGFRWS